MTPMSNKILSFKQKIAIRESQSRLNIYDGSVRSGKTVATIWRWIQYIGSAPNGDLIMIGKSIGSLYRNVIRPMEELLGNQMHYSRGNHELDLWGRKIFCFGAYDEGSEGVLRGMTAAGALGDEITLWPKSFFMTMLARLSVAGAKFFGATNPDSPYHWLKTDFLDRKGLDLYHMHFVLADNTFLPADYVVNLRLEYVGLWARRFIDGLWVQAEGAIYDFFDDAVHTIQPHLLPICEKRSVAIDYGTSNPTAFIMFGENPQTMPFCWAEDEYYHDSVATTKQKTDSEYVDDYIRFVNGREISNLYIDPSALSLITEFKRRGIINIRDTDNSVLDGIRTQASMLKKGEYVISTKCKQTIKDYGAYCWDMRAQKHGEDKPLKQNDHTKDPERYYLFNRFGQRRINYERMTQW